MTTFSVGCLIVPSSQRALEAHISERKKFGDNVAVIACGHRVILDYIVSLNPESVKVVTAYLETRYACRPPQSFIISRQDVLWLSAETRLEQVIKIFL
jgi:hypothetical protein